MREPTNRGPAVEIDELEKRLRDIMPPVQQPKPGKDGFVAPTARMNPRRPDPLAKLAELMPPSETRDHEPPNDFSPAPPQHPPGFASPETKPYQGFRPATPVPPRPIAVSPAPVRAAPAPAPPPQRPPAAFTPPSPPAPPPVRQASTYLGGPASAPPVIPSSGIRPPAASLGSAAPRPPVTPPVPPPLPSVSPPETRQPLPSPPAPRASGTLPPLPPLPTLPPLPRLDAAQRRDLPPPTFTPPSPPSPAYDRPDPALRDTLSITPSGEADSSGRAGEFTLPPGVAIPADSWRNERRPTITSTADLTAPVRPIVPDYPSASVAASYPPEVPAVDPSEDVHSYSEYPDPANYDEAAADWPDEAQYAHEKYDEYDESYEDSYDDDEDYDPDHPSATSRLDALRRKLRPWHAIAAVAALAVVSIGWSFLHRAGSDASREIATIEAPEGPMKVTPTIEPEPDAPTAGAAAVLDRNEPESVRKVVKNLEQAVDPSVAPQQNAAAVPDAAPPTETPGTVQLGAGRVNAPHEPPPASRVQQPRKVKSIAIPATPLPQPAAPATGSLPQPTAPATAKPATGPTFIAQFAAANTEAEARALIKTLSGKYGGAPGGGKLTFKPVKTGDKTVYRVRVGGITREAAEAVCAKAKTAGDVCAVVGN